MPFRPGFPWGFSTQPQSLLPFCQSDADPLLPTETSGLAAERDALCHLFGALPVPVVVAQIQDSQIVYANELFAQLFGLEVGLDTSVLPTVTLDRFFEPGAFSVLRQALLKHQFLPNYELSLRRLNETPLWGMVSFQLVTMPTQTLMMGVIQETTCSRMVEQALYERHQHLSAIAQHVPGLVYRAATVAPYDCQCMSGRCEVLTGYALQELDRQDYLALRALIHPNDRDPVATTIAQAITDLGSYSLDYRIITRSGTQKWIHDQGQVLSAAGEAIAIEGLWLDVTAYKQAEQESRVLQQLIQQIGEATDFDQALTLVLEQICQTAQWDFGEAWVADTAQTQLTIAPIWYGLPQFAQRDLFRARSLDWQFSPGAGLPGHIWQTQTAQWFADVTQEPQFSRQELARHCGLRAGFGVPVQAGNTIVAVLVFFLHETRQRDPRLVAWVSTVATELGHLLQRKQELQRLRQAEIALTESQRQLRSLIDALPGMFFRAAIAPGWPVTYMSNGCVLITGYTTEEFVQAPLQDFYDTLIHPEDRDRVKAAVGAGVINRQPYVVEYRIRTKIGQQRWVWEKGHGVYQPDTGEPLHIEGLISDISDRKRTEETLQAHLVELEALFAGMTDVIWVLDEWGYFLKVAPTGSPTAQRYPERDLINRNLDEIFPAAIAATFLAQIQETLATGRPLYNVEYQLPDAETPLWFAATLSPTSDHTVVWVARDITALKRDHEALQAAEAKYRSIFENALEGIFQSTPEGQYLSANPTLARIYGYDSPVDLISNLTDIGEQLYVDVAQRERFRALMAEQGSVVGFEAQVYRRDRSIIWISETAHVVKDPTTGEILYYEGLVMDITDQKRAEAELHHRAFYDALTNLPNRTLFSRRLTEAVQRCQTEEGYDFAVLFLDLDRFKVINDSLGHLVGDELLIAIARRLENCLREPDTVARLGGDEFIVLLDGVESLNTATRVAERIETTIKAPFRLAKHKVFTSISIGIVLGSSELGKNRSPLSPSAVVDALLRDADVAMYQAKAAGRGGYRLFTPVMHTGAVAQLHRETELHDALEHGQFDIDYEPIVSLKTGLLYGFEAQLHWQHPEQGRLDAIAFMPFAQTLHLSEPIYHWLVTQVCRHLSWWVSASHLRMHLNCGSQELWQKDLATFVQSTCEQHDICLSTFRFEVPDSFWLQDRAMLQAHLGDLAQQGIRLCINDFGLGVASLQVLHHQPIRALKLKASLVQSLTANESLRETLRIMILLTHQLQIDTIAEGVETEQQRRVLREVGCDYIQGLIVGEALPPAQVATVVARSRDSVWPLLE